MYDYDLWLEVVAAAMANLTDPRTPDDDTPIYPSGVEVGKPIKVDFWDNVGATVMFANVIKTEDLSVNKQKQIQTTTLLRRRLRRMQTELEVGGVFL